MFINEMRHLSLTNKTAIKLLTCFYSSPGDVLTFGSNQYGQLGAGDVTVHHRIIRVRVPKALGVAAGSNHTAVLTREGELYTFGSYQV